MNLLQRMELMAAHAILDRVDPGKGQLADDAMSKGIAAGLTPAQIIQQLIALIISNAGPQIIAAIEAWLASLLPKPA